MGRQYVSRLDNDLRVDLTSTQA